MQLSDSAGAGAVPVPVAGGGPGSGATGGVAGAEPCRFPKLEECAHFHYERVHLPALQVILQTNMDQSLHSQHTVCSEDGTDPNDWYTLQVTCRDECWLIQRSLGNFAMLDAQLHQCIYDRKVSHLPDIEALYRENSAQEHDAKEPDLEALLSGYLSRLCSIVDNSLNCGPILNWFQLDNRGHRLLVPSEESRSINTPAVAAAYSVRRYVSQARDELSLEVGDMISVIDMASPGESVWWRGKRGFQVGFFPQHCVHIIGDKVPRNMPLPPPVVGSLAISPIKPVLRKHGKLITFFRSFILNRPSRRRLKQSGILKERVFGCDLGEHLLNSGHDIPMVLKCCAEFIEAHGIVDGIYRLSGVTSNIQKLRNAFDEDRIPNLYTDDILQDIHSVASLLKMYFRELPNPLCTYQLYHSFVSAVQGCSASRNKANDNEKLLKMREAVQKLPPPHYRTLEYLMRHLARVAKHGASTGMTTRNVAIVWAPNLLRCEELEVGGVAALQGVGVQAVVTEFLVCYADLIFSDRLERLPDRIPERTAQQVPDRLPEPVSDQLADNQSPISPKRSRPKSLAISTPTKLLTLEEARNKHLLNKADDGNYIEVGGGPKSLPKKYHTVIELPAGNRKRNLSKRSPSGWRSFFSKSRNSSHGNLSKNRDISSPGIIPIDKSVTESDLNEIKRKLRPVKSAESLTSGQSEPATCEGDVLGPLHCLTKPPGHNRSVSHDSYFDNLQNSTNNSVGSLLDLSEIQLNFELEESEMRIFSEDESLVSSPKVQKETVTRKGLNRARPEDFSSVTSSSNPSPKKQPRVVLSPESLSRKRSRLEDQLSDIQYIDCNTPENPCTISTTAVIHNEELSMADKTCSHFEGYQPKNKSPRNSNVTNRHSLNFEKIEVTTTIPKSLTETDVKAQTAGIKPTGSSSGFNLTPQTPNYKPLDDTSSGSTPVLSPDDDLEPKSSVYENVGKSGYENVLTTINITYKSPVKSRRNQEHIYEDVELSPEEQAVVPTTVATLPVQEASQPSVEDFPGASPLATPVESPRLSLETTFDASVTTVCSDSVSGGSSTLRDEHPQLPAENLHVSRIHAENDLGAREGPAERPRELNLGKNREEKQEAKSCDSPADLSRSLELTYKSIDSLSSTPLTPCDNSKKSLITPTDELSPRSTTSSPANLSNCAAEEATRSESSSSRSLNSPSKSHTRTSLEPICKSFGSTDELSSPINNKSSNGTNDKRKSCDAELLDENAIYQQVKYFRRSIHEINSLLDLPSDDVAHPACAPEEDSSRTVATALAENTKQHCHLPDLSAAEKQPRADSLSPAKDLGHFHPAEAPTENCLNFDPLTKDLHFSAVEKKPAVENYENFDFSIRDGHLGHFSAADKKSTAENYENFGSPVRDAHLRHFSAVDKKSAEENFQNFGSPVRDGHLGHFSAVDKKSAAENFLNFGSPPRDVHLGHFSVAHKKSTAENFQNFGSPTDTTAHLGHFHTLEKKIAIENFEPSPAASEASRQHLQSSGLVASGKRAFAKNSQDLDPSRGLEESRNLTASESLSDSKMLAASGSLADSRGSNTRSTTFSGSLTNSRGLEALEGQTGSRRLAASGSLIDSRVSAALGGQTDCRGVTAGGNVAESKGVITLRGQKDSGSLTAPGGPTNLKKLADSKNIADSKGSAVADSSLEHFDSLEAEDVHLYENVEVGRGPKELDSSRSRMHDSEPKVVGITPEAVQEMPVCSRCSDENPPNLQVVNSADLQENTTKPGKALNVKSLTSRFEAKEAPSEHLVEVKPVTPTTVDNNSSTGVSKAKHVYDKDSLPPCLRAKNAKNSIKTRSLDENAFATEFGRPGVCLQRRKSLDDRTSSYINSKMLVEPQKVSSSTTDVRLEAQRTTRPSMDAFSVGLEQKLNRERIEKYKEERRNFWREKYRSESFKEDKDKLLARLKQKSSLKKPAEDDSAEETNSSEYKSVDRTNKLNNEEALTSRLGKSDSLVCKKLPLEALSKFEKEAAKPPSFRKHHSPLLDRKNRPSLKEISDKILDDSSEETVILRGAKEEEFLRHRRGDGESDRRRHTYDLLRERDFDSDTHRRVSLDTKTPRKEKCSPSYCIKDMKAIFESKSQQ